MTLSSVYNMLYILLPSTIALSSDFYPLTSGDDPYMVSVFRIHLNGSLIYCSAYNTFYFKFNKYCTKLRKATRWQHGKPPISLDIETSASQSRNYAQPPRPFLCYNGAADDWPLADNPLHRPARK